MNCQSDPPLEILIGKCKNERESLSWNRYLKEIKKERIYFK